MIRKITLIVTIFFAMCAIAQTEISPYRPGITSEGFVYFLPQTALRISVLVEKTVYTPGQFAKYAERYIKLRDVSVEPATTYRLCSVGIIPVGVPDTSKCFSVKYNAKNASSNIVLSDDGILLAVNAEAESISAITPFVPAKKSKKTDPRQYLGEDILTAGSTAKMAELTALDIYEVRESKNQLIRGQADFMPKDGEQMRMMLNHLAEQDDALTSLFAGVEEKDTIEYVLMYYPRKEISNQILFRLSSKLGFLSVDDLAGAPYYISIEDLHALSSQALTEEKKKKNSVTDDGIYVNVPGKMHVSISDGVKVLESKEFYASQFGNIELLSGDLFNKRYTVHLTINPITGGVKTLDSEAVK